MGKLTPEQRKEIIQAYIDGALPHQLAREYGITRTSIQLIVRNAGVIRSHKESIRKHILNESVFDLLNQESAYWLGFLAADGCRNSKLPEIGLEIQGRDLNHLYKFQSFLQTTIPIARVKNRTTYQMKISSRYMADRLFSLGIKPRKSLTLNNAPEMPQELLRHYYRGYCDGDGSIAIFNRIWGKSCGCMIAGTHPFLAEFMDWVTEQNPQISKVVIVPQKSIYQYQKQGVFQVFGLLNLLYSGSVVCLDRKQALYRAVLDLYFNHKKVKERYTAWHLR